MSGTHPASQISLPGTPSTIPKLSIHTTSLKAGGSPPLPCLSPTRVPQGARPFTQEDFNVSLKDVQLTKRIAKGAFGSVSKGLYHGETCAVKTLFRVDLYGSNEWLSELTILKNYCSHPNIISYHGAAVVPAEENVEAAEGDAFSFEGGSQSDCSASEGDAEPVQLFNIYVLSSFAAHGDLRRFWTKSEHLRLDGPNRGGWPLVMKLLQGANNALMYLHDHHVIHRDVKTKNIVVNDRLESELCDFGMARFDINRFVDTAKASPIKALGLGVVGGDGTKSGGGMNGDPTLGSAHGLSPSPERRSALKRQLSVVGTSEFMAPEIIFQEPYDHRCDTYSLGVVMAELMCRRIPCDGGEANDQSSGEEESAEDLFAEYLMESGTAAVTSGKNKPANVRQTKSKQGPEPATPRTKQALFLSRSARSWFKFNEEELVACQGAPAGLRDLCLECMQYQAEDRIDRAELSDWLAELHAQAEEEATNPLGK